MKPFKIPSVRWQRAALAFSIAAFSTFVVNFAFILWATINRGNLEDDIGTLFEGKRCSETKRFNTAIHIVINALSTILLAGSSYCMQCLIAPTRSEIDTAHSRKDWLDIGIPSIRNFWSISRTRKIVWLLLLVSSFPLHLLYNSVIFTSTSVNTYMVFQVNEKFVTDENMTITSTGVLSDAFHRYYHNYYMSSRTIINRLKELHTAAYENYTHNTDHRIQELNLVDCIADYGSSFQSQRGNLLLVTANDTLSTAEGLLTTFYNGPKNLHQAFEWMCPWNPINETWSQICDDNLPRIKQNPNSWRPFGSEIQKCYSQKTDEHCKLLYSSTLCWIVMALNLLKSVLMLFVAFSSSERPILTIGDAITSFIEEKDQTTVGMCLKSKHSFRKNDWGATPRHFSSKRHRKFAASSLRYWAICVILYICALTGCLYLLVFGMNFMEGEKDIVGLGFGALHSKTILNIGLLGQGSKFLVLNAMLANTPQVIMSLLYFNYNALYTGISLITEWDRFGSHRKGLRVSTKPQAAQRETYFLQLPYRYSLPLVVFSGVMHWLISQSIFLVNLEVYGPSETDVMNFISPSVVDLETPDNNGYPEYNFTTCGWSPLGVILVVVLAFCMLCFLVFSGSQRLKFGRLPLAGSCSAAISAACHSTAGDPKAWERELQWGVVVAATDDPGRCAFTSLAAEKPQEGKLYA